jgi:MSHA biogenesis protein MshI
LPEAAIFLSNQRADRGISMGRFFSFLSGGARPTGMVGLTLSPGNGVLAVVAHPPGTRPALQRALLVSAGGAEGLKHAVREAGAQGQPCTLTLEQGAYSVLQVERPTVPGEELRAAVRWRIRDMIDFPLEEAVLDVFEVPGLEQRGRPPSLYVAVARREALAERVELIKAAGLKLQRINITELALRNLAALLTETAESVGVLHLGERRGLFAICREGALYVARTIDHGLDDIALEGDVDALDAAVGAAARQEIYERIALEAQRTIDYYDSYFAQPAVRRLYVAPPAPAAGPLAEAARQSLGVEARVVDPETVLSGAGALEPGLASAALLAACGAVDEQELTA